MEHAAVLYSHCFFCIDSTRVPLTEIFLHPEEFDDYCIGVDTSITFCLKELRVSPFDYLL